MKYIINESKYLKLLDDYASEIFNISRMEQHKKVILFKNKEGFNVVVFDKAVRSISIDGEVDDVFLNLFGMEKEDYDKFIIDWFDKTFGLKIGKVY